MKFLAIASLASLVLGAAAVPGPIPVRGNISDGAPSPDFDMVLS